LIIGLNWITGQPWYVPSVGQFWFLADSNFDSWCDHRIPGMLAQNFENKFQNQNQNQRLVRTGPKTKTSSKINLVYLTCGLKKIKIKN